MGTACDKTGAILWRGRHRLNCVGLGQMTFFSRVCREQRSGFAGAAASLALALASLLLVVLTTVPVEAKPQFSAIAVDARNGKVLFASDPDGLRHPASLTKVMTLYLLFQDLKAGKVKMDTMLQVSRRSASMAPSKLGLRPGSSISVDNAIRALVTKSANDVAATIGENLGGTESAFAARMTKTARAIGMNRTTFKNASGLPNPAQVTTARDMATLSLRIQRDFPQYYPYFRIMSFTYKGQTIRTHNRLLGKYDGADGIKTGYIAASGFNLTSSARRGDKRVVGVVLGARTGGARNTYMMTMLDKAFPKCTNGKTIAAVAGSSKGAINPLAGTGSAPDIGSTDVARTEIPATADQQAVAELAAAAQMDEGASSDEDGAGDEATSSAPAEQPNTKTKVVEATIGTGTAPGKLPFAVKPEAQPSDIATLASAAVGTTWNVQVGAFPNKKDAQSKLMSLKKAQPKLLKDKMAFTVEVQTGSERSFKARFSGFTEADAKALCGRLSRQKVDCRPLPPQS